VTEEKREEGDILAALVLSYHHLKVLEFRHDWDAHRPPPSPTSGIILIIVSRRIFVKKIFRAATNKTLLLMTTRRYDSQRWNVFALAGPTNSWGTTIRSTANINTGAAVDLTKATGSLRPSCDRRERLACVRARQRPRGGRRQVFQGLISSESEKADNNCDLVLCGLCRALRRSTSLPALQTPYFAQCPLAASSFQVDFIYRCSMD